MKPLDVVPLCYGIRTRFGQAWSTAFAFYLASTIGYLGLLLSHEAHSQGSGLGDAPWLLLVAWIAYFSVHEVGYFMNDFWSQRREHARQVNLEKALPVGPPSWLLASAVGARAATVAALLLFLHRRMDPHAFLGLALVLASLAVVFASHNLVLYPARLVTFFLLYLGRYLLVLPFGGAQLDPVVLGVALAAPALGYAATYAIRKRVLAIDPRWLASGACFISRAINAFLIAGLLACVLAGRRDVALLGAAIGYFLLIDVAFVLARFVGAVVQSLGHASVRCHVHTRFSHDCQLAPGVIAAQANRLGLTTVFVTDHADTFSAEKYEALQKALAELNQEQPCRLVSGLEYAILGQHFLAIDLSHWVTVDPKDVRAVSVVRQSCARIVWAHPLFAIRRLLREPGYRLELREMMATVDAMEWMNLKSLRGINAFARHLILCFVAVVLFGKKQLTIGLDAHTQDDWRREHFVFKLGRRLFQPSPLFREN